MYYCMLRAENIVNHVSCYSVTVCEFDQESKILTNAHPKAVSCFTVYTYDVHTSVRFCTVLSVYCKTTYVKLCTLGVRLCSTAFFVPHT